MEKGPLAGGTRAALTLGVDTEAGFECTAKMRVPSWRRARRPEGVAGGARAVAAAPALCANPAADQQYDLGQITSPGL